MYYSIYYSLVSYMGQFSVLALTTHSFGQFVPAVSYYIQCIVSAGLDQSVNANQDVASHTVYLNNLHAQRVHM